MSRRKNISAALRKRNLRTSENAVNKKGMELPVNTLVVVAIAVIVILAIAAFFMGGFGGSSKDVQNRQNFLNACSGWVQTGCDGSASAYIEEKYAIWQPSKSKDGEGKELDTDLLGGLSKDDYLKRMCGCYGTGAPAPSTTPKTASTCKEAGGIGCYGEKTCTDGGGSKMANNYECKSPEICCKSKSSGSTGGWNYG